MYHMYRYMYALILSTTILLLILHQDKKKKEVFQHMFKISLFPNRTIVYLLKQGRIYYTSLVKIKTMILKTYFNGKKLKHQNSTNCLIYMNFHSISLKIVT